MHQTMNSPDKNRRLDRSLVQSGSYLPAKKFNNTTLSYLKKQTSAERLPLNDRKVGKRNSIRKKAMSTHMSSKALKSTIKRLHPN